MKIGIVGGTFDPIHEGHLMLGKYAYEEFSLDEVWFLPNGRPPHKSDSIVESSTYDRVMMTQLAVEPYSYFKVCTYEADLEEVHYTYLTLEYFKVEYPEDEFYFILGADSLFSFESWKNPQRIFDACTILAACRDEIDTGSEIEEQIQYLITKYHARIKWLHAPLLAISSTSLRNTIHQQEEIKGLPLTVSNYIKEHGLYKGRYQEDE